YPQAQAPAFFILGGEEGLVEPAGHGGANAGSVVGDGDPHAAARGPFGVAALGHADADLAAAGFERVDEDVREHLAQLAGQAEVACGGAPLDLDGRFLARGLPGRVFDFAPCGLHRLVDYVAKVEVPGRGPAAVELERLLGNVRDALDLLAH